jgi:hypothetical protein
MIINKLGIPVIYNYHEHLISNNHIYKNMWVFYPFIYYNRIIRNRNSGIRICIFIKDGRK